MGRTIAKLMVPFLALGLVAAACSSGSDSGPSSPSSPSSGDGGGGGGTPVSIKGFAFNPNDLTGSAGGTLEITLTNNDSVEHSFTLDDNSVSQDIESGATETVSVTLPDSGSVGWHCKYHPTMTGTITVG